MHRRANLEKLFLSGLIFGVTLTVSTLTVFGHAKLVRSEPQAKAELPQAPKSIQLWFSEELESSFSTIIVHDQNGKHVDKNNVSIGEGGKKMQIDLEDLPSGTYTVEWKALSTDQHTMKGNFSFTVTLKEAASPATSAVAPATTQKPPKAPMPTTAESTQESGTNFTTSIVRWLEYLAMMTLFGGFAFRLLVLAPALRKANIQEDASLVAQNDHRFIRLSWLSLALLALTSVAGVILQTAAVLDTSVGQALAPSRISQVIGQTSYGGPWLLKIATLFAIAIVALLISLRRDRPKSFHSALMWVGLGLTLLMLVSPSLMGHAVAAAKEWPLAVFSDWLHLAAAGFWVGGLFHLVLGLSRATTNLDGRKRVLLLHNVIPVFTRLAIASTLLIAITGVYNSWIHVGRFSALWTTAYGKTLSIKVLLFIPMLVLGGLNTFVIHPRAKRLVTNVGESDNATHLKLDRAFRRSVAIEAALGVIVLLAAAVLVFLQPAREHPSTNAALSSKSTTSQMGMR